MPQRHKTPKWEREDNRTKIFTILFDKSYTFTELLEKTGFARSTLTQHLKDLQAEKVIEKAIENGRVVYRSTLDEDRLFSEFKKMGFDMMMKVLSRIYPEFARLTRLLMRLTVKAMIFSRRMRIEGTNKEEFLARWNPLLQEIAVLEQKIDQQSQERQEFMSKYYDYEKKDFNKKFWKAMSKISIEELKRGER